MNGLSLPTMGCIFRERGTGRDILGPHQHFIQKFVDQSHVAGDGPLTQRATVITQERG